MQPENEHPLGIKHQQSSPHKRLIIGIIAGLVLMVILMALIVWQVFDEPDKGDVKRAAGINTVVNANKKVQGVQLDLNKNYGNKYADGILPVGDSHYVTDGPKKGYVYMCNANFVPAGQAGAQTRGPWFVGSTAYDINKKVKVDGQVVWAPKMDQTLSDTKRLIKTNDLPTHVTGIFPVSSKDPAYAYDRNPNSISEQDLSYSLEAKPIYGTPKCMGMEAGIMLTGAALFNGFDAGGRDAGAWEVQDNCDGHPQNKGEYHYHSLSSCITSTSVSDVIGFALDGFPITGPKVDKNNILTTSDLDECHGLTSQVNLDDKKVVTYHYVMTQDFPYSISCFRGTAIQPPGNHETAGGPQRR